MEVIRHASAPYKRSTRADDAAKAVSESPMLLGEMES